MAMRLEKRRFRLHAWGVQSLSSTGGMHKGGAAERFEKMCIRDRNKGDAKLFKERAFD